ncbi:TOR binding protein [Scheffersomyces stipitis CBS 6054]|uniref:TOR binding protein n=1 Tax=Scheffersomyces stipitis (strain ATCC 58785 / CBS 6054 / NBRC 10063 / NRRL Y-11545) TaxID=322104 RepID=A3LXW6_PICST|nr:TOR binding protein [Scheffersomyces stipitis CBS 6054]ABN67533.2 TOR binding protein [Scheffersomyces stipitis CBS 6054]
MKTTKSSSNLEGLNAVLVKSKQTHQQLQAQQVQNVQVNGTEYPLSAADFDELRRQRASTLDSMSIPPIESIKFYQSGIVDSEGEDEQSSQSQIQNHHHRHHRRTLSRTSAQSADERVSFNSGIAKDATPDSSRIRSATTSAIESTGQSAQSNGNDNTESPTWLFSDLLSNLGSFKDKDEYYIVAKGNDLVLLLQQYPALKNDILLKNFINKIQFMFCHNVSEVRSTGYRILRHVISSYETLMIIVQSKILIFIIATMSTTRSTIGEKEQALKLVREFLNIENGTDNLSIGVIKSLISLIESSNEHIYDENELNVGPMKLDMEQYSSHDAIPEPFKNICVETICEIALLNPELVFHSGGFKVFINIIIDGSFEMASSCSLVILNILDLPNSRKFLRNGYDLNSLIAVFSNITDEVGDSSTSSKKRINNLKLQKVSFLIASLLKNFNGLIAFSVCNFKSLKNLISNLKKRNIRVRDYIMDILQDILRLKSLPWLASSPIGEIIRKYNSYTDNEKYGFQYQQLDAIENEFAYNIITHYQGLLALILIKNDIFTYLIDIVEQNLNESNTKKATGLITHLYSMANNILPPELVQTNLALTNLSSFSSFEIEKVTRQKFKATEDYNANLKSYLKNINIQSKYNIDDNEFKMMINNTKILTIKEFEDWNWQLLLTLIQGPLTNPKRFDEVLEKNPKFFKRLMSFYRPFKFRFCNIAITKSNSQRYINIGCQLLELFLSLENGTRYLSTSKLLPQLSEIFAQVDKYSGISTNDAVLSRRRLDSTASIGYLRFIGVFSSYPAGLKILEQWQFYNLFLNIIEGSSFSESTNSLLLTLFKYVDFTGDNQFRILLSQCFKVSNFKLRSYLLRHLLPRLIIIKECELFVIRLLVNNLYDPSPEIVSKSIDILSDHYSTNKCKNLNYLIDLHPSIQILSRTIKGRNLLINFLNIPSGFRFLEDSGFIEEEFDKWSNMNDLSYLNRIEKLISASFFPTTTTSSPTNDHLYIFNFFKYLLSTEEGLNYFAHMKQKTYLENLINEVETVSDKLLHDGEFIDVDSPDEKLTSILNRLKQNLWIIGNIASGQYGIQLLDPMYNINLEKSVIAIILELFDNCPIWNIRGACFYVLGMVATTIEGIEILDESNWVSVLDQYSNSKCLTYPKLGVSQIFNIGLANPYRDVKYYSLFSGGAVTSIMWDDDDDEDNGKANGGEDISSAQPDGTLSVTGVPASAGSEEESTSVETKIRDRVINLIQHLNSVLSKIERKAVKELLKMKRNTPEVFEELPLFLEVIKTIDKGNFRYHKRKFIFDLFLDTRVFENLIKKERKNSIKV